MQNNSYSWNESFLFSQQYESSGSNYSLLVVEDFIRTFLSPENPRNVDEANKENGIPPRDHPEEKDVHPLEINLSQEEGKEISGQRKRKSSTLEGSKKAKYSRKSSPSKLGKGRGDKSGECCDCKKHYTYIAKHKLAKHPEGLRKCIVRGCKKYFGCDNSRLEHKQKDHPPDAIRDKFFCCEHCHYSTGLRNARFFTLCRGWSFAEQGYLFGANLCAHGKQGQFKERKKESGTKREKETSEEEKS
ncbi:Hypothetical predicted protein [Cloeon dipterum]|uniref:Uncharacterized protein n=1 Tax=Cloeon dipterum TaxID=197152 RepID=A0A8S1DMI6_9INSE|nr:Hypothetical predicted protein [Cloeon dipterum]